MIPGQFHIVINLFPGAVLNTEVPEGSRARTLTGVRHLEARHLEANPPHISHTKLNSQHTRTHAHDPASESAHLPGLPVTPYCLEFAGNTVVDRTVGGESPYAGMSEVLGLAAHMLLGVEQMRVEACAAEDEAEDMLGWAYIEPGCGVEFAVRMEIATRMETHIETAAWASFGRDMEIGDGNEAGSSAVVSHIHEGSGVEGGAAAVSLGVVLVVLLVMVLGNCSWSCCRRV